MKRGVLALMALAAALTLGLANPASEVRACGAFGPFDFDTYEAEDYITEYAQAIHVAAEGQAGLPTYHINGEPVDLAYQGLETGPRYERNSTLNPALRLPPSVLKSIAWIEASWANASGLVPYGGAGPALVSPDCGYGLGQITSGMANTTGTPSARQAAIGTHPLFNLAEAARILADKWNSAPNFRPIAGYGDPAALEDWYFAIWSYNGFAFSNHPLNPNRDPLRAGDADSPIYHCFDPNAPSYQGAQYGYGDYTYPERVYGCMRHPPTRDGRLLWEPQTFRMPNFGLEIISSAFAPSNFLDCENGGFSGGCPSMDFATTIDIGEPEWLRPHPDTHGPADPAWRARWLGDPVFSYSGPSFLAITAYSDGSATSGVVRVRNVGLGVGPFRIRTSHPWIVVRHDNDPFPRNLDGSVAVGSEIQVVLQKSPRVAQAGWDSVLRITVDPAGMPEGLNIGTVHLEPLLGGGGVFTVQVAAAKGASNLGHRANVPGIATD